MAESKYNQRMWGLPTQPKNPRKTPCGICDSEKSELLGDEAVTLCPHCDIACRLERGRNYCGVCEAGMKGLPDPEALGYWAGPNDR